MLRRLRDNPRITINLAFAVFWIALTPVAYVLGWLQSVTFVSLLSIAALAVTNLAAWLAEMKLMRDDE